MKISLGLYAVLALLHQHARAALPTFLHTASSVSNYEGVRTEVLGYSNNPTVQAYFERFDKTNGLQDCMFEQLSGDASSADVASWTATVSEMNPNQWSPRSSISDSAFGNCLRTDYVDGQGLIRESCWIGSNGFLSVAAAFDSSGHVLDLVRYLNVKAINFTPKMPLNCKQTKFKTLPIRMTRRGGVIEVQDFVQVADETTLWTLTQNFGLPATACHPSSEGNESAGSLPSSTPTSVPTLVATAVPTLASTPKSTPAALPTAVPTPLPKATATAIPTEVPTLVPTPTSTKSGGTTKGH